MSQSELDIEKSFIWNRIGPIADFAAPFEKFLDEEQKRQIAARELDLRIKVMEQRLETLRMISQMLKKKV